MNDSNNLFERYRNCMIELVNNKYKKEGSVQSEISSLDFYFSDDYTEEVSIMYEPSICIILQGSKVVFFENETYTYNEKDYLVSSTYLPAKVKIVEKPYIALRIRFKLEDIYDVLKNIELSEENIQKQTKKGLFFDSMNIELYESIYRLVKLLERKEDINYLQNVLIKEILYNLIKSKAGYFISKFSMEGTMSNKIVRVISEIKENFSEKLNIKKLADSIDMSESSLYQHFKTITSMSPIQFQKKIRLEEAKQLLFLRNMEVNEIAFTVGYESPSQFSREYTRMFGMSPKAHSNKLKNQIA